MHATAVTNMTLSILMVQFTFQQQPDRCGAVVGNVMTSLQLCIGAKHIFFNEQWLHFGIVLYIYIYIKCIQMHAVKTSYVHLCTLQISVSPCHSFNLQPLIFFSLAPLILDTFGLSCICHVSALALKSDIASFITAAASVQHNLRFVCLRRQFSPLKHKFLIYKKSYTYLSF